MNAHDLIRDFGLCSGLPAFALDDRGLARLKLDGEMIIDFEFDSAQNLLHIYSTIAPAPHAGGEAELRLLMEANLFLDRSGGVTCALDSLTGEFLACLRLDPELYDGKALVGWLERMADSVERLRGDLTALTHGAADPAENDSGFDPGHPFA